MLSLVFALALRFETDLTFLRHGETVANATGKYNARTLNEFSAKGQLGVDAANRQLLSEPRYLQIYVSPSPRALKTIAPYLRATHKRAVIWPLLYECCTGHRPKDAHPTKFGWGPKITLPADLAPLFVIEPGHDRFPVASDYNAGLAQVAASLAEFRAKCSGQRVLLVGHSGQGGHLLHDLTGVWRKVDNAKEIHVHLP